MTENSRPGPAARVTRPSTLVRRQQLRDRIARFLEANPGRTGNQIQAGIGGNRQTQLEAVRDLMAAGLVTRHRDPADPRVFRYTLTAGYRPPDPPPPAPPPQARVCVQCGTPLPYRKKRYCSDACRVRKQKAENVIENGNYAEGLVRQIRRMGTRASNDLTALAWLSGAVDHARDALALAVAGCRAAGYSDAEIGHALGITRQAVGERFGRKGNLYTGQPGTEATA